jgi:hypothetical protein
LATNPILIPPAPWATINLNIDGTYACIYVRTIDTARASWYKLSFERCQGSCYARNCEHGRYEKPTFAQTRGHWPSLRPTEYIFYCKKAILFLSSSKILTPNGPTPSPPGESVLPPQQRRGVHTAGRRGGWRINNLEDERNRIALLQ